MYDDDGVMNAMHKEDTNNVSMWFFFFFFSRLFLCVFLFYFPNIWIAFGRSRLHQFFSTVGSIQFIRVSVEYYFFVSFEFRSEILSMFFFPL